MNIFIAHTPLQNFIACSIAKQYFADQKSKNLLFSSSPNANLNYFGGYSYLETNTFLSKIKATLKAKKKIKGLLERGMCNLFIPHTGALLDNYFFYEFPNYERKNKINFYYEGILYFYEYREPFKRKTHLYRKIFGTLSGMTYQYSEVIFPAMDNRVDAIYTILPKYTLGAQDRMKKVDIRRRDYRGDPNRVLILGGKPSLLLDQEVIELYREMLAVINKDKNKPTLLFKGHHADKSLNFQEANAAGLNYEDITQAKPIEEIVEDYNPGIILSYPSSGLINLKEMYGSEIEMICFYPSEKRKYVVMFENIFSDLGIKIRFI